MNTNLDFEQMVDKINSAPAYKFLLHTIARLARDTPTGDDVTVTIPWQVWRRVLEALDAE